MPNTRRLFRKYMHCNSPISCRQNHTCSVSAATRYQTQLELEVIQYWHLMAIVRGHYRVKVIIIKGHRQLGNVHITLDDRHQPWSCQLRLSRNITQQSRNGSLTFHAYSSVPQKYDGTLYMKNGTFQLKSRQSSMAAKQDVLQLTQR